MMDDTSIESFCAACGLQVPEGNALGWTYCSGGGPECGDLCPSCSRYHDHNDEP